MKLSKNFSLSEFERSETAERLEIDNAIPSEAQLNLRALCVNVLQPLRNLAGEPLRVNSGYRCEELNKAVGGVPTSQHRLGEAADVCWDGKAADLYDIISESNLEFDQVILYRKKNFVHVSYTSSRKDRRQLIIKY